MFTSRNIAVEDVATAEYTIHQLHFHSLHLNCLANSLLVIRQNSGLQKVFTPLVFSLFTCLFLFSVLPAVLSSLLAVFFGLLLVRLLSFTTSTFHDCDSSEVQPSTCSFSGPCRIDVQAGRAGIHLQPWSLMYPSILSPWLKGT